MTKEHGPARQLIERAIRTHGMALGRHYQRGDIDLNNGNGELDAIRAIADEMDARHAALVEAAQYTLGMMDRIYPANAFTGVGGDLVAQMIAESRKRLRAALDAAQGDEGVPAAELEPPTCSVCGGAFTAHEWDDRHSDNDGEDCHEQCCPTCRS